MASSSYKDRINKLNSVVKKQNKTTKTSTEKMASQLNNYKTRAEAAGVEKDTRNPVEKFLGLPEDQNVLFDVFEILGRPQQALFGGIQAAQEGEDVLEGAKQGITGEQDYYFGDILRNAGVDDKPLFTNPINGEDTSLADIVGLAGDIVADPVDLALWATVPATGGATAPVAVANTLDNVGDVAKAAKIADKASDVSKVAKIADTTTDIGKATQKSKIVFAPFQKGSKSTLELGMGALGKGVKKAFGVGDKLVEKGLSKVDEKSFKKAIKELGVNEGLIKASDKIDNIDLPKLTQDLTNKGYDLTKFQDNLSDTYKAAKQGINKVKSYKDSIPDDLYNKIDRADNALDSVGIQAKEYSNYLDNSIRDYLKNSGKVVDEEVATGLASDVATLISSKYAPETNAYDFLNNTLKNGKNSITGSVDEINNFSKQLDALNQSNILNYSISKEGTKLTLKKAKGLEDIVKNNGYKDILANIKIANKQLLSPDVAKRVANLDNLYKSDANFKALVDKASTSQSAINEMIKKATNGSVSFDDMLREGFTKNTMTKEGQTITSEAKRRGMGIQSEADDILRGNKKITSGKKHSNVADEAENQIKKKFSDKASKKEKAIETLKGSTYDNKIKQLEKNLENLNLEKSENIKNFDTNINKLNLDKGDKERLIKGAKSDLDNLKSIIDEKTLKRASELINDELPVNFVNKINKYTDALEDMENIRLKFSNPNLSDKEVRATWDQFTKAQEKLNKLQDSVYLEKAKIEGALIKKDLSNVSKATRESISKSSSYTKKMLNNDKSFKKLEKRIASVQEGYNKIAISLDKKINQVELKLDRFKNMTDAEKLAYDNDVFKEISKLQRDFDFLKSAEGIQFYETSFLKNLGDFANTGIQDAKNMNRYNEILLHSGLNDDSIMKFIPKGEKAGKIPVGYTRIGKEEANIIISNLEAKKNFLPESQDLIKKFKKKVADSDAIIIDKDLKDMLKINISENEVKPLVKMIDGFNNTFKKYKVLTPGFHLRNITGNATNMIMSGVPAIEVPGLYTKANKLVNADNIVDLFSKKAIGTLTEAEAKDFDILYKYMQGGFLGQGKDIQDLGEILKKATDNVDKSSIKKVVDKVFELNMKGNTWVDNRNRMALLLYADRNPRYISKLGVKDSIDAVKHVLFDPHNMSPFEKKYLKKIVPFYTFTKQNLIFHADNIMKNTSKYKRLIKTFDETYDSLPENSYKQYQKENMEIPVFQDELGNVTTLKSNLPVSDLGEYMSDPLRRLVSSTSPLIKAPFELTTGVDTFTGQELYKPTVDQLASYLGIDTITTSQANKVGNLFNDIQNDEELTKTMADILPSVLKYNDSEKIANSNMYEDLEEYQALFKKLKNQGIDIPTIRELSDNSSIVLKNLKSKRAKIKRSY